MTEPGGKNIVDVLDAFLESRLADVHTQMPGKIVKYDEGTGLAQVQPLVRIKRKINEKTIIIDPPLIDNVPVMTLDTSNFRFKIGIKKGDQVAVFFSETGIGNFINGSGKIVDPDDLSRFDMTDAFCIPGLWGQNKPSGTVTIDVSEDNKVKLLDGKHEFTKTAVNLLSAAEPFVKGNALESLLNTFLSTVSTAGKAAVDPASTMAAVQSIGGAADVALLSLSTIKSTTIKGE